MRFLGGMMVGSLAGRHAARRQFEAMQAAQAQQEQINQAQTQAAQAQQIATAAAKAAQTQQTPGPSKKNIVEELERLANLKQQGILTEEEFQQFKTKLLSDF
jgi:multidrug resistance efflux pump